MVRLPESERKSIYDIEEFLIRIPGGGEMPLNRAVTLISGRAYTEIRRVDGFRVLNVTANVVPGIANENQIIDSLKAEVFDELLARYPGLKYSFSGRQKEQRDAMRNMLFGSLSALLAIFSLLAILFRSYTQSIMVMLSILFGIASALGGHILMGYNLSVISVFGMIALCGVVINGGLALTVTANRMRDAGDEPSQAAINAGLRRFRPIVLTALTTFLGLAPMIFETSVQARFLIPMTISLGYGILFSTVIILLLMPVLYTIQNDLKNLFKPISATLE